MNKYKLKKQYQGKHIALSNGLLISDDFFGTHGFTAANQMIEADPKVAKYFTDLKGAELVKEQSKPAKEPIKEPVKKVDPEKVEITKEQIESALERNKYRELQGLVSDLDLEAEGRSTEDYRKALEEHLNA